MSVRAGFGLDMRPDGVIQRCRAKEEDRKSQMGDFAFLVSFDAEFQASFGPRRKLWNSLKFLKYFKFSFLKKT